MNKLMTAFLGMALCVPALAFAQSQDTSQQDQQNSQMQQHQANTAASAQANGVTTQPKQTVMGMVSDNGKYLTVGDTKYQVGNPHSLQKYDNQNVSVTYQFDANNNTIHVLHVKPGSGQ